jgi:hypothetical protein
LISRLKNDAKNLGRIGMEEFKDYCPSSKFGIITFITDI